jgi:hypothetical protein
MRAAWVSVVLVACGSSAHHASDAMPDADLYGEIDVEVVSDSASGAPLNGAQVAISDPDGFTHEIVTTDGTGHATGHVRSGGSVTKLPAASELQLWTILAVEPGDHVVLGPEPAPVAMPTAETVQVAFPYPEPGAVSYSIYTSCGNTPVANSSPATVSVGGPCPTIQALAIAQGSTDAVASTWSDAVPFVDGATLPTHNAWQPVDQVMLHISNVPAGLQSISFIHHVGVPGASAIADSMQLDAPSAGDHVVSATHVYAPAATYTGKLSGSSGAVQYFVEQVDPNATTLTIDAAQFLPPFTTLQFDPTQLALRLGQPPPQSIVMVQASISWVTGSQNYIWNVVAPGTGNIALPRVSSPAVPPSNASGTVYAAICATDGIAGYAAARANAAVSGQTCGGPFGAPGTFWAFTSAGANFP